MTVRQKILFAFVLGFGLIVGCSTSNNIPEDGGISGTGVGNAGVADANAGNLGGQDTINSGAGTTDAGGAGTESSAVNIGDPSVGIDDTGSEEVANFEQVDNDVLIDLNGDYGLAVSLSDVYLAIPECEEADGMLNVTGTTITGTVGDAVIVTGLISSDGTISGGFAFDDEDPFATYDGMLDGEDLVGNWEDEYGCGGTWRAVKVISE